MNNMEAKFIVILFPTMLFMIIPGRIIRSADTDITDDIRTVLVWGQRLAIATMKLFISFNRLSTERVAIFDDAEIVGS